MLGEGPWEEGEDADDMWLKMATCVRKVASEVFGVSRGGKHEHIVGTCTKLPESHSGQHQHGYHLSLFGIQDPHGPGEKLAL